MMKIDKTLNWLFERYLEDPNKSWDISLCNKEENEREKIHAFGKHMARKGYVKNVHYTKTGFDCCITTLGILQVSNLLNELKYKILEACTETQKNSAVEILNIKPEHFQRVLDTTAYLKRMGLIECIIKENDVLIKATSFGEDWYKNNKRVFA